MAATRAVFVHTTTSPAYAVGGQGTTTVALSRARGHDLSGAGGASDALCGKTPYRQSEARDLTRDGQLFGWPSAAMGRHTGQSAVRTTASCLGAG